MAEDPELKDPIAFVREIVRSACWGIDYHEKALPKAYAELSYAKKLMSIDGFEEDDNWKEDEEDGDPIFENFNQFITHIVEDKKQTIEYHEKALKEAQIKLGYAKIMLMRGNYTEIDIEEIRKNPKRG